MLKFAAAINVREYQTRWTIPVAGVASAVAVVPVPEAAAVVIEKPAVEIASVTAAELELVPEGAEMVAFAVADAVVAAAASVQMQLAPQASPTEKHSISQPTAE